MNQLVIPSPHTRHHLVSVRKTTQSRPAGGGVPPRHREATSPPRLTVATRRVRQASIGLALLARPSEGVCLSVLFLLCAATPLQAASPDIRFDTADLVSCRDVTTPEFKAANTQERLVEGHFRITAMVEEGEMREGMQYAYQILNPTGRVRIVDYQPQTQQATAVAGNVSIERKKESNKSLGLSVNGSFESIAHGTAGSDIGTKDTSQIRYELKPPMEVVLVAGTMDRGTGVYFKLRPSPDEALEGSREFSVVMRVPDSWRGEVMYVRCEAQENRRGSYTSLGVTRFVVGLYVEGDEEALRAAENLVLAEATLRRTVAKRQRDIQKRSLPTLVHKVGALLDMYDPRIPDSWLERLIYGPTNIEQYDFYGYLPPDVRNVADRYRQAKRRMYQLGREA